MNRIPAPAAGLTPGRLRRLALPFVAALASACGAAASDAGDGAPVYDLEYRATLDVTAGGARVELRLDQSGHYLRELDMSTRGGRIGDVSGDGEIKVEDGRILWRPPESGGRLRWFSDLEHRRGSGGYDARVTEDWALFRAENLAPPAATRTRRGAESRTRLVLRLPEGWSSVTPYPGDDHAYRIENPARRFQTPTGWIVLGDLGVRNETIAGVRIRVAGPRDHGVRRMDILALLNWSLPELLRLFPDFPERLTVVSAGDPMWRGALSAPTSIYIHAERPLISENGTSTLLHETVHVGLGLSGEHGADWIIEGLAEYYSLQLLRRSGSITTDRYRRALRSLAAWGRDVDDLCVRHSTGATTARAVGVIRALDEEMRRAGGEAPTLDALLAELAAVPGRITVEGFRARVARAMGRDPEALKPGNLPGCD